LIWLSEPQMRRIEPYFPFVAWDSAGWRTQGDLGHRLHDQKRASLVDAL